MALHINIEDLLSTRIVESDRIEFKEGWNPDAIYRSICAFANDFENLGGGYILVGVEEDEDSKTAKRPVKGLSTAEIALIQRKMIGLNNLIQPVYHAKLSIEDVDGNQIIVLWIPGGSNRPYKVPESIQAKIKNYFYFIRKYANSVKANNEEQQELINLSNNIPFDDRANTQATVNDISMLIIQNYLRKINSRLAESIGKISNNEILHQMELLYGPEEHLFPRNVGLMMFSETPDAFFPYTQVDIIEFPDGEAAPYLETDPIKGTVPSQIKRTLDLINDKIIKEKIIKPIDKAESIRIYSYPMQAIEETLVNAFYHRDYQVREPIEIRIYPNSIVFINHGGPDRSIQLQAFNTGQVRSRRYRNRRLGEFLKELDLIEGRATGIPTILKTLKDNGSPPPHFNTDDDRTYFEVELFIHPAFIQKKPFTTNLSEIVWNVEGVNNLLNSILDYFNINERDIALVKVDAIAGVIAIGKYNTNNQSIIDDYAISGAIVDSTKRDIAGDIADNNHSAIVGVIAEDSIIIDNLANKLIKDINEDIVSAIANAITKMKIDNDIKVLQKAKQSATRDSILGVLGVSNHRKNYNRYMLPLIEVNWLTMTIPNKPTSPKQQYFTTLKGRLILEFLKHKTK